MNEENAGFVESEDWQLDEIREGLQDLDRGEQADHEKVESWMRSGRMLSEDAAEFVRLALMEKPGLRPWKFNREELYEDEC